MRTITFLCSLYYFLACVLLSACNATNTPSTSPLPLDESGKIATTLPTQISPQNTQAPLAASQSNSPTEAHHQENSNPDLQSPMPPSPSPPPNQTPTPDYTATPDIRPLPRQWRGWPLVPTLSPNMISVFLDGQAQGKDPFAFSTLGDCQSEPPVFLGIYNTDRYYLGTGYEYLQDTINFFSQSGSFGRQSYCTQNGLSVASALSPAWADPTDCLPDETPLACEIRIYQPSLMFINLGTNWSANATASHEAYLRQIVDIMLAEGIIPILSTKGDNIEGDWSINESIAQVAYDYDLPLWNFWVAIQNLPQHGLDLDRPGGNYLIPDAWDRRSFTGLQVLDVIRKTLEPYYP